jgi:phasin
MAEAKKAVKTAAETFTDASNEASNTMKSAFPQFGFPNFEFPKFELPGFEVPAPYRELTEKGIAQAKQNFERSKETAEEMGKLVESTYAVATKGASEYGLKMIETMRANVNAYFDFTSELLAVKSPSEVVELSSVHARKTFETLSAQGKELATLAQKVSTETAEPIKTGFNKALRLVA